MKPTAILLISLLFFSCEEKMTDEEISRIGIETCQGSPSYVAGTGLDPKRAALSTSEKKIMGLVLIELDQAGIKTKEWQHQSWSKFGWMGAIASDDKGNNFVAPAPVVSVLDNPVQLQNIIYRVDGRTAEMKPFLDLGIHAQDSSGNPYGLVGLFFDCHSRLLYASSIAGSDRLHERGKIYAIDPVTAGIVDEYSGFDAMGLCVSGVTGEKKIFVGSARDGGIYSIRLNRKGKFTGSHQPELSLDLAGPRGDDKARRIRFDRDGTMIVQGISFNYNLTAASEKLESLYRFAYHPDSKSWKEVQR